MKNQQAMIHYLRDIERRARQLAASDVFNGTNPKTFVRTQASFVRTDVRRLTAVLRKLGLVGAFEWSKKRA